MSATIHYRVTSTEDPYISVGWPSEFIASLERAFGHFPCELKESDLPILRGLSAAKNLPCNNDPYVQVMELIGKFGSIELYASY